MNETATWLSLAVIFALIVILVVVIVALQTVHPSDSMQFHVECLADVLLMVAGSDEVVTMVHERGVEGMKKSGVVTRLGWFRDKTGVVRWGIEAVGGEVEWVDGPEDLEEDGTGFEEKKEEGSDDWGRTLGKNSELDLKMGNVSPEVDRFHSASLLLLDMPRLAKQHRIHTFTAPRSKKSKKRRWEHLNIR
jgi:hypothetical protein